MPELATPQLWTPPRGLLRPGRDFDIGLPRNGLVLLADPYRDAYGRNVLPVGAEDFTAAHGWTKASGGTTTVTPGQADPFGGNNAYRIQGTGASFALNWMNRFTGVVGLSYVGRIWAKKNEGAAETTKVCITTAGTDAEPRRVAITSAWQEINLSCVASGAADIGIQFMAEPLDVTVMLPQLNLGPVLHAYSLPAGAPGTLQVAADYRGGLYPLQLGSGATADAADPAFTGVGMLHAADYLLSGSLAGITLAGDWTLPIICKPSGTANTLVSLASASAADQYQAIEYNGSTKVRIKTVNGATVTTSDDLTVSATAVQMLILTSSGDTLTLKRMDAGTSVTATNADPTGTARLCIGALGVNTVATPADALEWHLLPLYGRAWTAGEATKSYVYSKSLMARRGVTLA